MDGPLFCQELRIDVIGSSICIFKLLIEVIDLFMKVFSGCGVVLLEVFDLGKEIVAFSSY